jgi:hypothetical protein
MTGFQQAALFRVCAAFDNVLETAALSDACKKELAAALENLMRAAAGALIALRAAPCVQSGPN